MYVGEVLKPLLVGGDDALLLFKLAIWSDFVLDSLLQPEHHLWEPRALGLSLGDRTVICGQERRTEEASAPTVATLTPVATSQVPGAVGA